MLLFSIMYEKNSPDTYSISKYISLHYNYNITYIKLPQFFCSLHVFTSGV